MLFAYHTPARGPARIRGLFAECRDVVYDVFRVLRALKEEGGR